MDPSASVCFDYDSLQEPSPILAPLATEGWYRNGPAVQLTPHFTRESIQVNLPPQYVEAPRYETLQRVKDAFATEGFIEARDATNPFEYIGRSIFINRAAVKLANIDAVHHVSGPIFTFDKKQSDEPFTFCDVAAGPGGFTQYLQYRFPGNLAKGYGMTLRSEKLDWSTKFLDMTRFTPFYGPDKTGDLYTNWEPFIQFALSQQPQGVDLVTGDGGFDLEDAQDSTLLHRQEFLSSRLLLTQALVGIGCTKTGGTFVVKIFDTVTSISAQILFILAQCFEEILIFKPVSSRPANAERYVICRRRHRDVQSYYQLLAQGAKSYTEDQYLASLFVEPLPAVFTQWLVAANVESLNRQATAAQNILLYLQGQNPVIPVYNLHKFLIIWNLPDNVPDRSSRLNV
jgi:23S rRNA U2552 (ribose-2'-O)-methylase RlmE/FtsJ